jgi:cytochrome b subunit of formate dehydrogenase
MSSKGNTTRVKRFTPVQRFFHLFLMTAFLTQAATGLGHLFIETKWGKALIWTFGGVEMSRTIHVTVGILMIVGFMVHFVYLLTRLDWRRFPGSLSGPDSLVPNRKDLFDFFRHTGWFLGLCKPPRFDRWGYWEKFDYWAVFWGIPVLGLTGLMLAYPLAASGYLPGYFLNVAFWIHRIEALLAMAHVFLIHFFIAHLRPHNFPMDRAMFEGSTPLESVRHERPDWLLRLEQSGDLEPAMVEAAPPGRVALFFGLGYVAVLIGVMLLIGGLINIPFISW